MANFIERLIKLTVNNSDANTALNKTATNLDKVDKNTTKVTQSTKTMTKETRSSTEAIVSNGGAMGLLNDLTGGLAMTFKDASEAIGLAGVSLNSFKGIMIATGIGALVVAVGYLATNWEKVADAIGLTNSEQEKNNKLVRESLLLSEVEAIKLEDKIQTYQDETKTLKERQEALNGIAKTITSINGLKIGVDDKLINNAIDSYLKLIELQDNLKNAEAKFKEAKDKELETRDAWYATEQARIDAIFFAEKKTNEARKNVKDIQKQIDLYQKDLGIAEERVKAYDKLNKIQEKSKPKKVEESQASKDYKQLKEITDLAQKRIDLLADKEFDVLDAFKLPEIVDTDLMRAEKFKSVIDNENKWYDERISAFDSFNQYIKDSTTLTEEEKAGILYDSKIRQTEIEQEKWDFITNASANAAQDILNIVSLFGEKSKKDSKRFAIASVIIEQARATGEAINNLVAANAKAVAASPLTGGQPWVTINTVSTALGIAGGIAGAAKSIRAINAETLTNDNPTSATGGGSAPQAQFNIVGASGNNQLAAAIGAAQNQPVNAYVVGSDMTTQQALDRNRITTATFL